MSHIRFAWAVLGAALGAAALAACSGDEEGAATGTGAAAGTGGGSAGGLGGDGPASGGSGGGKASGGSSTTGGSSASGEGGGGGEGDPGPQCLPRDEVPAPIPRTTAVEETCFMPSTCGGNLAGTTWEVESACFEVGSLFPSVLGICSALGSNYTVFDSRPSGTASFGADDADLLFDVDVSIGVDFPNVCHGCQCSNLETALVSAGIDASCNPVCNGGTCFCTLEKTVSLGLSGSYTAGGGDLEVGATTLPYCIADGALTLQNGSAVYTLRPPEDLHTPEICDGIDNDGNGSVDDALAECPTCSNLGACGLGVEATCNGASGWSCVYTSPEWEQSETLCDALDNDCDGVLNDELDCKEFCDGKDNDGIGGIDDDAFGPPTCTAAGVCGAGYSADCNGAAGWRCQATSGDYELAETKCDGLDNDCDGLADERCCAAGSAKMYYAYINSGITSSFVARANLDGSNIQNLVTITPARTLLDVALDAVGGKIYWANLQDNVVQRSDLNGMNLESPLASTTQPRLALDVARRFIFWPGVGGMKRANLDNLADVITLPAVPTPQTMTVDTQHGWLFIGYGDFVHRVDLDGENKISIGPDIAVIGNVIEGIAVDPVGNKLYWTSTGGIHRANLDLTQPEKIMNLSYPHHLFIDPVLRRFYWSETVTNRIAWMDIGSTTPAYFSPTAVSVRFGQAVHCPPP